MYLSGSDGLRGEHRLEPGGDQAEAGGGVSRQEKQYVFVINLVDN